MKERDEQKQKKKIKKRQSEKRERPMPDEAGRYSRNLWEISVSIVDRV